MRQQRQQRAAQSKRVQSIGTKWQRVCRRLLLIGSGALTSTVSTSATISTMAATSQTLRQTTIGHRHTRWMSWSMPICVRARSSISTSTHYGGRAHPSSTSRVAARMPGGMSLSMIWSGLCWLRFVCGRAQARRSTLRRLARCTTNGFGQRGVPSMRLPGMAASPGRPM